MKRVLLLIVFLIAGICTFAQSGPTETIYLSNGSVIKCTVVEQTKDQVKIMTSDGSVFVYEASQVERIVKNQAESSEDKGRENSSSSRPFIKGVRFNGYFDMKLTFGGSNSGYTLSSYGFDIFGQSPTLSLGARIFDYGYVGMKSGFEFQEMFYNGDYKSFAWMVPLMSDVRGYFPINKTVHPYVEIGWGRAWTFSGKNGDQYAGTINKFNLGTGIDLNHFSLGFGWNATGKLNQYYFKIGVKIGRGS